MSEQAKKKSVKHSYKRKKKRKKGSGGARIRQLWPNSRPSSMACKFYDEQTMLTSERKEYVGADNKENKTAPTDVRKLTEKQLLILKRARARFIKNIKSLDPKVWECLAILHDKDTVHSDDDIFVESIKKHHWHLIIRRLDGKRFRPREVFELLGINYNGKDDFGLFTKHGCETILDFIDYSAYLIHVTEKAKRELKHIYDISEIISNQTPEHVKKLIDSYNHTHLREDYTLTSRDWDILAKDAEACGEAGGVWFDFVSKNLTVTQQSDKRIKVVEEYYNQGLEKRINSAKSRPMIAILIHGDYGIGKSYTAGLVLHDIYGDDNKVLKLSPGTGMFDNITPATKAVILDDIRPTDVYNLADHTPHPLRRRNKGNAYWLGDYVVATTNDPLKVWFSSIAKRSRAIPKFTTNDTDYARILNNNGFGDYADESAKAFFESYRAAMSRFYVCTITYIERGNSQIKVPQLTVEKEPNRGIPNPKEIQLFEDFRTRYNTYLENYFWEVYKYNHPNITPITYTPKNLDKLAPITDDDLINNERRYY